MTKAIHSESVNRETHALKGRVAIVTGGGRGIGRAIAIELARQGARVAVCARSPEQLAAVAAEIKDRGFADCLAATCDVRKESDIAAFMEKVAVQFKPADILVNNAGIYKTEPVENHCLELWQDILQTNLTSAMLFCRAALPGMLAGQWGRIINISSISGRVAEIWGSAYSASKFGMIGLTQSLALEVASKGITVNAICPGWVSTQMSIEQLQDPEYCHRLGMSPEEAQSNACFAVPQNRFIDPQEVAALAAYLATDAACGITGQSINVCGGLSLH